MSRTHVTVRKRSAMPALASRLEKMRRAQVYVGIPRSANARQDDEEMNNATLLSLLTNGSPANNLPPTPIVEPAIEKNRATIAPELALAAQAILQENPNSALQHLKRAGMVATNGVKRYFTDPENGWPPNAPSTIKRKGSDKRNIDTSQLRRAMTYAVTDGDRYVSEPETEE